MDTPVEQENSSDVENVVQRIGSLTVTLPGGSGLSALTSSAERSPQSCSFLSEQHVNVSRQKDHVLRQLEEARRVFVETVVFKNVRDYLNDANQLILLGAPGSGKTTMSQMLLHKYRKKKYEYHFIESIDDCNIVNEVDTSKSNILIFDDIFGKSGLNDFVKWKRVLKDLDIMFQANKFSRPKWSSKKNAENAESEANKPDLKVIFTSRNHLFKLAQAHLGEYKRTLMKCTNVFDLSQFPLNETERKDMLLNHSKAAGITLKEEDLESYVTQTKHNVGFPYSCKMFQKVRLFQKNPEKLFSNPFVYLKDSLEELLLSGKTPGEASALVLTALRDGKLRLADLIPGKEKQSGIEKHMECLRQYRSIMTDEQVQIEKGADSLKGTFLEIVNKVYEFSHPTVYDAVACIMGDNDPNFVLQYCSMKFIQERVHLESTYSKQLMTNDYDFSITIPSVYSERFVRRFADEIMESNFSPTFAHDAFNEEEFVDNVMEELEENTDLLEIFHKTDKTYGQCFLFWIMFSSASFLVEKAFECTKFEDDELLEGYLGCAINGNIESLDIIVENSRSLVDRVTSLTVKDILAAEVDAEKLMKTLTHTFEQNQARHFQNPFLGVQNDGFLHIACIHGHKDVMERLLGLGCDVNSRGEIGRTPLMYASRGGHDEVADSLLTNGADINIVDEEGACAFHLAARGGHIEVMKIFLKNGIDINKKGEHGRTPLLYACRYGYPEFVKFCLENGADFTIKTETDSCLHLACKSGSLKTVQILVEHGMDVDQLGQFGRTPIHYACRHGNTDVVNYLKTVGADLEIRDDRGDNLCNFSIISGNVELAKQLVPSSATEQSLCCNKDRSAFEKAASFGHHDMLKYFTDNRKNVVPLTRCLISAAYRGHMAIVKLLIGLVDDINETGYQERTALITACIGGKTDIAILLIKKGADIHITDKYGNTRWHYACYSGILELIKLLLKKGFSVKTPCQNGMTPFVVACSENHQELFHFLLKEDGDGVFKLDNNGLSCLHHCCSRKHDCPVLVKKLLDLGMNVNCRDRFQKTPAMEACRNGAIKILHCLKEHGADMTLIDINNKTCLHYACYLNKVDNVKFLIDHGVNINCVDNKNTTPLIVASFNGHASVVDVLLQLGADASRVNSDNETCADIAKRQKHDEVLQVLRKHGVIKD